MGRSCDWVLQRWAPWLDETYPFPAKPGEIRYFMRDESGKEIETTADDPDAMSRTFIPAKLADNPYLDEAYRRTLNLLPEPLRSQLLHGDWAAGQVDDAYQIIPRAWIKAAMARWRPDGRQGALSCIVVDVARGGQDKTVIAKRCGKLTFINKRAEHAWKLREALDPNSGEELALPNDPELLADLCAPRWRMQANGIKIESKDEIRARIGRSPDCGDAVILALAEQVASRTICRVEYYKRSPEEVLTSMDMTSNNGGF